MVFAVDANALPLQRFFQDAKLPTQQMIEKQYFGALVAATTTSVLSANAGPTSAAVKVVSVLDGQPDVPRNLVVTPGGTTGDIEDCVVAVAGTNWAGSSISENFTFLANATGAQTGSKAFKAVSSVTFPANCESGGFNASWSIGVGEKIGLKRCMANVGDVLFSLISGSKEGTGPTMAVNASDMASNTADFNGTMNGGSTFTLYFMQNYGCFQ